MRPTLRRGIPILVSLAMLFALAPLDASAATLQRTWSARMGTNGANGRITIRAYTIGTGTITYALTGLRANRSYAVQIRNGTCSHVGTIAARPTSIHTSSTGKVSRVDFVYSSTLSGIWSIARKANFIVRIVNGTSARCGALGFAHATRVAVSGLGIDLPVVRGPSGYPYCRVAMYLSAVAQPREPGITFIFAHARTGMFLPLLTAWKKTAGASLLGVIVRVWTSDSYVSWYHIVKVRKTSAATTMDGVLSLASERLWLQTSTGPNYTYPKLIVEAVRYKTVKTTYAASHPTPHPLVCS
jgi:hypothetical protein